MRTELLVSVLLTPLLALGCGGAAPLQTTPPTAVTPTTEHDAEESPVEEEFVAPPTPPVAPLPHVPRTLRGDLSVNCDFQFPREDVPDEPTLLTSGALRVRAQSLVLDNDPEGPTVMYCAPIEPLAAGEYLVLWVDDYGPSVGTWNGRAFVAPVTLESAEEDAEASQAPRTVVLPGQVVTAVRYMAYCPVNPSRPCLAAGDFGALSALSPLDPNGPRSGWDFDESTLRTAPARVAVQPLEADACGLTVSLRGQTECAETTLDDVTACLASHYLDEMDADPDSPADAGRLRAQRATRLVFSDGTRELTLPAYEVSRVACVEGVALLYVRPAMFGSRRSFVAVELADQRIARARGLEIVDHEEGQSECANAWDGVALVPIVGAGALVGGVVRGAGGSPRFDVSRGDVGEGVFVPAEEDRPYGTVPLAFHVTDAGLAGIEAGTSSLPPVVCPLRIADEDGQTNVRPDPSTRHTPVGTIPTGTVIQTVEQRGRWYRIEQPLAGWLWSGSLSRRCTP